MKKLSCFFKRGPPCRCRLRCSRAPGLGVIQKTREIDKGYPSNIVNHQRLVLSKEFVEDHGQIPFSLQ